MAFDPAPATDGEIIAWSLSEPECFAEIFERHYAAIHRYLACRVGTRLADDLAAQLFAVAFERRPAFRPETVDARPWLYGIAVNLIRNHRRSEKRHFDATMRFSHLAAPTVSDIDTADVAHDRSRLARALAELDPNQRDVLLLHAWGELSHVEIAASLGIPQGTVASRLSRARLHLRTVLARQKDQHDAAIPPPEEP